MLAVEEHRGIARATTSARLGPDTLRYLPQLGYAITGTGGMLAAALSIAATSWLIVRTAVFGRWLGWLGAVVAIAVVVASAFLSGPFAIPAVLVWALAVSAAMWRRPAGDPAAR